MKRPTVTPDSPINSTIEFTTRASTLYGADNETIGNYFSVLAVAAGGVAQATTAGVTDGFDADMVGASGRLSLSNGMVIDPATSTTAAAGRRTFDVSAQRVVRPDVAHNRIIFFLSVAGLYAAAGLNRSPAGRTPPTAPGG